MAKIIYLEDTITLMANTKNGMELVQRLAKIGEFKQTENGYRYIVIENNNEADGRK